MEVLRVVYDTNIYISGIFWSGPPKRVLNLAREDTVDVFTSQSLMEELRDVLTHPRRPFRLNQDEVERVLTEVRRYVRVVIPTRTVTLCRDKADNAVIECALAAEAQYIVTGDSDLRDVARFEDIEIVSVQRFLEICKS